MPAGLSSIFDKLKKRCRTLLIPYIIANILTFLFYAALNVLIWRVSALGSVVNFKVLDSLSDKGIAEILKFVFINPPVAFQLWFIRELMVVMLFTPLIYIILKRITVKAAYVNIALVCLLAAFVFWHSIMFVRTSFWFVTGGLLAMSGVDIAKHAGKSATIVITSIYIVMSVGLGLGWKGYSQFIPLVGVLSVWMLYDMIADYNRNIIDNRATRFLSGYTFFVYLCHEPLLNIFKKMPLLISRSEIMLTVSYITIPVIFYLTACLLGHWLKIHIPKLYSIYTGGR